LGIGCRRDLSTWFGRRPAIIDLSESGKQLMRNEDGTVWVTFNGEIYNYRELKVELSQFGHVFRSQSDTEVLLHGYEHWGMEGLLGLHLACMTLWKN
jgi:asparagine synthase (glutamine-hydrolysing)